MVIITKHCPPTHAKVDQLASMMVDHGVTFTGGVPTIFTGLQEIFSNDLPHFQKCVKVDRIVIGGSAPPKAMMRWYKDNLQCDFYNAWGMTESVSGTSARRVATRADLALNLDEQFEQNVAATAGFPLPHLEVKLIIAHMSIYGNNH
jgi:fatty-acyl-CoA synthase